MYCHIVKEPQLSSATALFKIKNSTFWCKNSVIVNAMQKCFSHLFLMLQRFQESRLKSVFDKFYDRNHEPVIRLSDV